MLSSFHFISFHFISLLADTESKTVPLKFPQDVYIQEVGDVSNQNSKYSLPYDYRRGTEPSQGFLYFLERIVAAISPKTTNFKRGQTRIQISKIFTVSDEAFALLFLFNEYDGWKARIQNSLDYESYDTSDSEDIKKTRMKKRFTDSKIGSREGWSYEGRKLYLFLFKEVEK